MELEEDAPGQLHDRLAVRIFTLCDHAVVPPDGKIYIHGGGVHTLYAGVIPGTLKSLYLVVRLSIPWHMLGEPHTVKIHALDLDRKPISSTDPLITTPFELGKPPGHRPGDESAINICAELNGLVIQQPMTIRFHLTIDDEPIASLPLKIMEMPMPVGAPAR
jgi:hypothetical protein